MQYIIANNKKLLMYVGKCMAKKNQITNNYLTIKLYN